MARSSKTTTAESIEPSIEFSKRVLEWVLPIIPKGHNSLNWSHWANKKREADRWKLAVKAIPLGPWPGKETVETYHLRANALRKVRMEVLVYRKALQDPDNAVASCKYLVDALVARGWAVDDSRDWMDCTVTEKIDRKNTRTEITWEAL